MPKKPIPVKVIEGQRDEPVRVQIVRKRRKKGKPKPKKQKEPLPVRIVPDPPPPPPTKAEIRAQEKAAKEAQLAADREARYNRNVALNAKESQQGLVLGEKGLLNPSFRKNIIQGAPKAAPEIKVEEKEDNSQDLVDNYNQLLDILQNAEQTPKIKQLRQRLREVRRKITTEGQEEEGVNELIQIIRETIKELDPERAKRLRVILSILEEQKPLQEVQIVQTGKGVKDEGMWDYEIENFMKKYPHFKGVISADEIKTIEPDKKVAFVMNTANRDEPGEHWVSVFINTDKNSRSVEYFDPFGQFGKRPSKKTLRDLQYLIDKINPPTKLLLKVNQVKQQNLRSNTCGLHAINFLIKRINGKSFIEATGYEPGKLHKSAKYEREVARKFDQFM